MATVTGLTRTEVSKLVRTKDTLQLGLAIDLNRATRVANGWKLDSKFVDARLRPKRLPFSSSRSSFSHLVRKYSGDIPPRAMLAEMIRLGMVCRLPEGVVRLLRDTPSVPQSTIDAFRAITPWIDLLTDCNGRNLTSTTTQIRISFKSVPEMLAAIRELEARKNSFKDSIQQLGTKGAPGGKFDLKISIAVATERPRKLSRKEKSKSKE